MSNAITEKYFEYSLSPGWERKALEEISRKTGFAPEKEIFRGKIYDSDKVGSVIYKGVWDQKPVVLKIQGLSPEINEAEMIERFNAQNESKTIRLPKLYTSSKWNEKDRYGFLLLEYINAPRIYTQPFANEDEMKDFCRVYEEYKSKCLKKPFFEREPNEYSSLVFTTQRVSHWAKIAQSKGYLTKEKVEDLEKFLTLSGKYLPTVSMEFMHGHFGPDDIFKISDDEYVLMSNLFWSYRPEFYDSTFHLWAGTKSVRDQTVSAEYIKLYLESWKEEYQKISSIARDIDFEKKFYIMMAERCIGALLVDISNQQYESNRESFVHYLTEVFREVFKHCTGRKEFDRNWEI